MRRRASADDELIRRCLVDKGLYLLQCLGQNRVTRQLLKRVCLRLLAA